MLLTIVWLQVVGIGVVGDNGLGAKTAGAVAVAGVSALVAHLAWEGSLIARDEDEETDHVGDPL